MNITSARYANADNTAAVITTIENSAVAISQQDAPALWAQMLAFGTPSAYQAPVPQSLDDLYDQTILTQRVLKAIVLALNDGTLPIATNKTPAQLKTIIKAKM